MLRHNCFLLLIFIAAITLSACSPVTKVETPPLASPTKNLQPTEPVATTATPRATNTTQQPSPPTETPRPTKTTAPTPTASPTPLGCWDDGGRIETEREEIAVGDAVEAGGFDLELEGRGRVSNGYMSIRVR